MTIRVYENLQDLTGIGEEWLVDSTGNTITVFIDGNLRCGEYSVLNVEDVTKAVN